MRHTSRNTLGMKHLATSIFALFVGLLSSQNVFALGFGTNSFPYADDFESYTNGQYLIGPTNGWISDAEDAIQIVSNSYIYTGESPLTNSPHRQYLKLDSGVTNVIDGYSTTTWVDLMLQPRRWDEENPPVITNNPQLALYVNSNGYIMVYAATNVNEYLDDPNPGRWIETSHLQIDTGAWIRLTIELGYLKNGSEDYFHIQLNNSQPLTNYYAHSTPTPEDTTYEFMNTNWGAWFLCAGRGKAEGGRLSEISFSGSGLIDDFVVTNGMPNIALPHNIIASTDPSKWYLGANLSPYGNVTVIDKNDLTFSITNRLGYIGTNVIVDGVAQGWTNSYTFLYVTNDHSITALTMPEKRTLTIVSDHGSPNPPVGTTTTNDYNTVINASIANPTFGIDTSNRLACTGWTRTTSSPGSGNDSTQTTFTLTGVTSNDVTTNTWVWKNQYLLTTAVSGYGTLDAPSPSGYLDANWYTTNTPVTLIASTNNYQVFQGWQGDTNGAVYATSFDTNGIDQITNQLQITFTMDRPRSIVAVFNVSPKTAHGTPYSWLDQFAGFPGWPTDHDDSTDFDNDGVPTYLEYVSGTDPTDPLSVFHVLAQGWLDGSNYVTFFGTSNSGVTTPFGMYFRSNLVIGAWQLTNSSIPRASNGTNTWWHVSPPTGVPLFYRPTATNNY